MYLRNIGGLQLEKANKEKKNVETFWDPGEGFNGWLRTFFTFFFAIMIFVFLCLGPAFLSITFSALGPSVVELFYLSEQQKFIHVTIYCLSKGANFYQEMPTSLVAESKSKSNFVDMDKNNNSDACVLVNVKIESKCKSRL